MLGHSAHELPLGLDAPTVCALVDRIAGSVEFQGAHRQQEFLRFVAGETLAGRGSEIKETLIAIAVYEKRPDYDPRVDSTVRVEASKLRSRLSRYYEGTGAGEVLRLTIPKGAYAPLIESSAVAVGASKPSWMWVVAGIAVIAIAALWIFWPKPVLDISQLQVARLTENGAYSGAAAGRNGVDFVVYGSDRGEREVLNLWKHPLDGGVPARLTRSAFQHETPTLSADGKVVVFRTGEQGGMLAAVDVRSGSQRLIKDSAGARQPRFSPQGALVAYWVPSDEETQDYGRVFLLDSKAAYGHGPIRLFGDFAHAKEPVWSEDGRHILALGTWHSQIPEREFDAWVLELDGTHSKGAAVKTGLFPLLKEHRLWQNLTERSLIEVGEWRDGWLYFTAQAGEVVDLFRVRISRRDFQASGAPQRITSGTGRARSPRFTGRTEIVFARADVSYDLYSLDTVSGGDLKKHTSENGIRLRAALDPSGRFGIWEKRPAATDGQVWSFDLVSGEGWKLGWRDDFIYSHGIVSPDGATAAYRIAEAGKQPIYSQPVKGGAAKRICDNCGTPADWTADGKHIFYVTGGSPAIIGILEVSTGKYRDLIHHPSYNLYGPRARLDGKGNGWVVFYAENGRRTRQIFLAPMRGFAAGRQEEWVAITDGANWDQSPAWSPDGKTIFYVSRHEGNACIMARAAGGGPVREVLHLHSPRQTMMRSINNRGADALWAAGGRLYFLLDDRNSDLWKISGLTGVK